MPIQRCSLPNGKKGYKWGPSGKCYPTREGALKQMRAIKHQQSKSFFEKVLDTLKDRLS
jgi:hypothetical protein